MTDNTSVELARAISAYEADNMKVAFELFTALANQGEPIACQYLGLIFKSGDGVGKDPCLADFWYTKHRNLLQERAISGDFEAALDLGKLYQYGDNVEVNWKKALSLFRRAADGGHSGAQFHLASIHKFGWCGCGQNLNYYEYWLNQAIDNGHPEALYMRGIELIKNHQTRHLGFEYVRRSAQMNFWPAQEWINRESDLGAGD